MDAEAVGDSVEAWAAGHGLVLLHDGTAHVCHTSSERGECFQLVVRPPFDGQVTIELFSIETFHDEELHQAWTVSVDSVSIGLDQAWVVAHHWKQGVESSD